MMKRVIAGLSLLAMAGCSHNRLVGRSDLTVVNADLPKPAGGDLILQQRSYVIGPLDRVVVDVYGAPDLSRTAQVDASGVLTMPLIGNVPASTRTPPQLAADIEARLRGKYMRNPNVSVTVDTVNQVVTVDGQVQHPGLYPVQGRMTLIRAVSSASGLANNADASFVVVYREVGGKHYAALYDIRAIRQGRYADPEIYANDVITVGGTNGNQIFQAAIQAGAVLAGPLIAITR